MALTISNREPSLFGNKSVQMFDMAFDSSYAFGGESLTPANMGLETVDRVVIEPKAGYTFEYDATNEKVKAFCMAPPIVYEEVHTIASNQITLDYPAAAILNVSSATQCQKLIEPGDTLAANEVQLAAAMSWGARPTLTFHASTSGAIKVTYITQAWKEMWDNRQASTSVSTSSDVADLDEVAVFIESCQALGSGASSRPSFVRGGDAAGTGECEIDFTDSGEDNNTTLTFASGDAISGVTLTYVKQPSTGFLVDHFVEDEDLTIASGTGNSAYPILFNSICGQIPDYHAAGERTPHTLLMAEADLLGTSAECAIDWHKVATVAGHQVRTNDTTTDAVSLTYMKGFPYEIPNLVPLEVKNGEDLSSVLSSVRVTAYGV